jgi:predicted HicB family RNase H-like nuclease
VAKLRGDESIQAFNLRLPKSLHKLLSARAIKDRRSLNDEMLFIIESWIEQHPGR